MHVNMLRALSFPRHASPRSRAATHATIARHAGLEDKLSTSISIFFVVHHQAQGLTASVCAVVYTAATMPNTMSAQSATRCLRERAHARRCSIGG
jgi:hypothetical protein